MSEQPHGGSEAALTLQRAMPPAGLPVLPHVWLAAHYLVAAHELDAGGDWFDAVPLGRGRVALTVGDVVGHGDLAAAAMGQLRTVLIEALMDGLLAADALARLGCADDVTLLAAELRAEPHRPLVLELPAEAVWLRGIRRALDEWLHGVGAGPDDVPAVHLAVVEAATNCVEHAYQGPGGWRWCSTATAGCWRR